MTYTRILQDNVMERLAAAVAVNGRDFRYTTLTPEGGAGALGWPGCYYHEKTIRKDVTTRCLIGEVLHQAGVSDDELIHLSDVFTVAHIKLNERNVGIDALSVIVLSAAQVQQDQGATWGEAYDTAAAIHAMLTKSVL